MYKQIGILGMMLLVIAMPVVIAEETPVATTTAETTTTTTDTTTAPVATIWDGLQYGPRCMVNLNAAKSKCNKECMKLRVTKESTNARGKKVATATRESVLAVNKCNNNCALEARSHMGVCKKKVEVKSTKAAAKSPVATLKE